MIAQTTPLYLVRFSRTKGRITQIVGWTEGSSETRPVGVHIGWGTQVGPYVLGDGSGSEVLSIIYTDTLTHARALVKRWDQLEQKHRDDQAETLRVAEGDVVAGAEALLRGE